MRRTWAEERIIGSVKADLRDPEVIAELERRVARALAGRKSRPTSPRRLAELQRQVENLADAIASGGLKGSPCLTKRLAAAEAELQRLEAEQCVRPVVAVARVVPKIRERYLEFVAQLEAHFGARP